MTPVVCGECKKRYDYEVDDFCPRCGAYNRPDQRSTARRVDGVNETGMPAPLSTARSTRRRRSGKNSDWTNRFPPSSDTLHPVPGGTPFLRNEPAAKEPVLLSPLPPVSAWWSGSL